VRVSDSSLVKQEPASEADGLRDGSRSDRVEGGGGGGGREEEGEGEGEGEGEEVFGVCVCEATEGGPTVTLTLGAEMRFRMAFGADGAVALPFKFHEIIRFQMAKTSHNTVGREGRMRGKRVIRAKHATATCVSSSSLLRRERRAPKQGVAVISYSLGMVFCTIKLRREREAERVEGEERKGESDVKNSGVCLSANPSRMV